MAARHLVTPQLGSRHLIWAGVLALVIPQAQEGYTLVGEESRLPERRERAGSRAPGRADQRASGSFARY